MAGQRLTLLSYRLDRASLEVLKQADEDVGNTTEAVIAEHNATSIEIIARYDGKDGSLDKNLFQRILEAVRNGATDKAKATVQTGSEKETINLLSQELSQRYQVEVMEGRNRVLRSDSMFQCIDQAWQVNKDQILGAIRSTMPEDEDDGT